MPRPSACRGEPSRLLPGAMSRGADWELDAFERVDASPGRVLLRISGRSSRDAGARPTLIVDDGRTMHRLAALPSAGAPAGRDRVQVAFSAPSELLGGRRTAFALELGDGD